MRLLNILIFLCFFSISFGQPSLANYSVARNTGTGYTSIVSTGSAFDSWRNTVSFTQDDNRSDFTDIGFDFWYNGTRYTQFSVSTNGFLDFSSSTLDGGPSGTDYSYDNAYFTANGSGTWLALAPFYDDMTAQGGTDALGNSIKYLLSGSAPNRVLTVEWINMAVYGNTTPDLNFQVKLYETTGIIEFNYGTMVPGTNGFSYTCGINAATLANTPTVAQLNCQQTANTATFNNTQTNNLVTIPATNSQIVFTPPTPTTAAGALTFSAVTQTGMTLNWPDWATNETGYVIYNSTDNVNFSFVSQSAIGSTSSAVTGLLPSTTYYWKLYAVAEGHLSSSLNGTQATLPAGTVTSIATGFWDLGATWSSGVPPTASDNVIVTSTHTVTIRTAATCNNLTVGQGAAALLRIGDNATSRAVTINNNLTVTANATFNVNAASDAVHTITFKGDIINNGTINFATDALSLCNSTFTKSGNQTVSGSGATTTFNRITLNMGTLLANTLEITTPTFVAASNYLTLTTGTFKLSTSGASVSTPYSAAGNIPLKGALWLNSAASTMSIGDGTTIFGELNVSNGTLNAGNAANEDLLSNGGKLTVSGGTLNVAGKYYSVGINNLSKFTMTGGTVIVPSVGSTNTTIAPFQIAGTGSQFNMTGGTLIIPREGGTGAQNLGFVNTGATGGIVTGGVLQIGSGVSPAGQLIQINTTYPIGGLRVSSANVTATLLGNPITVVNDVTINSGTLTANSQNFFVGGNWTNNVAAANFVPGTATVTFNGTGTQSINGTAASQTFNNLTNAKTAGSLLNTGGSTVAVTVNNYTQTSGNFAAPATFNVNASATSAVIITAGTMTAGATTNITGNWTNNAAAANFSGGTGTVRFIGTGAQQINGTATAQAFNHVVVAKTAGTLLSCGGSTIALTTNDYTQTTGNFTAPATFNVTAGAASNLLLSAGTLTAGTQINVTGNWTHNGGTFTPGAGTVAFTGAGAQQISGTIGATQTFNNLTVAKTTGTLLNTGANPTTLVTNNLTITSGNFTAPATLNVNAAASSDVLLTAGTLTAGTTMRVTGDWTNNGGTFAPGTNTVTFTGTGAQQINGTAVAQNFHNVILLKTAGTLLNTGGSIATITTNNYTQTTGNFTAPATLNVNATATSAVLISAGTFTSGNQININGNWTNNAAAANFVGGTGTVNFTGTAAQFITGTAAAQTFNHIAIGKTVGTLLSCGGSTTTLTTNNITQNTGNFTAPATLNMNAGLASSLTINAGTFTAGATFRITGNWTNNAAAANFVPGANTVTFTGTGAQQINGTAASQTFNNVILSKTAGSLLNTGGSTTTITLNNYTQTTGNFTGPATLNVNAAANSAVLITAGRFTSGNQININGNWTNNAAAANFVGGTGTVRFTGTAAQLITGTAASQTFNNVTVLKTAGTLLSCGGSTTTLTTNDFTQTTGNFTAPATFNVSAGLTSNVLLSAGTLIFPAAGNVTVTGNWTANGGTFTPNTSTVTFTGTIAQTIFRTGGETFYNAAFSNAGTKTLNSPITTTRDFTINNNSPVDVSASNHQITVRGNFSNSGTFTARSGNVFMNGTIAQTIGGTSTTDFFDLTLNNNAGASLLQNENIIGALVLNNGIFNVNTRNLTLISTATGSGRIAQITGSGDISGNVIVQRYAPGGYTGWAFLGAPLTSALTYADWDDDIAVSCNSCPDGYAAGFESIYYYDETVPGLYDAPASYVALTTINDPIVNGRGYWVYLGDGFTTTNNITMDVTGAARKFAYSLPLNYTNTGAPTEDGWNLISNPYPSPILWSALRGATPAIDNAIYVYNADLNGGTGSYAAYVNGISSPAIGSGGIDDNIPICQGFYVHSTGATSLSAQESNKTGGNPTFLRQNPNNTNTISTQAPELVRLYLDGLSYHDETVLYLQNNATDGFDFEFDSYKLAGGDLLAPAISLQHDTNNFQINGIAPITSNYSTPLKAITGYSGNYTITADGFASFSPGACITLYDTYTGITTDLRNSSYSFTLSDTTLTARFTLNITINPLQISSTINDPSCLEPATGKIIAEGVSAGPWNYYWKDQNGIVLKTSLNKTTADTLDSLIAGTYLLEINTAGACDNNSSQFVINAPINSAPLQINSSINDPSCLQPTSGKIVAIGTNVGPWDYTWKDVNGLVVQTTLNSMTADTLDSLSGGNYLLEINTVGLCDRNALQFAVDTPNILPPLQINSSVVDPACSSPGSGQIVASGVNGGPWNYYWKDQNGNTIQTSLNSFTADTLNASLGGVFTLEVNTVSLCDYYTSQYTVNAVLVPTAVFAFVDTIYISLGGIENFNNASINSSINYWDFGDGAGASTVESPSYIYQIPGSYTVTLVCESSTACFDTTIGVVTVIDEAIGLQSIGSEAQLVVKTLSENQYTVQQKLSSQQNVSLKLFDALGKVIMEVGPNKTDFVYIQLDLREYVGGIYYLKINNDSGTQTIKLIKQ